MSPSHSYPEQVLLTNLMIVVKNFTNPHALHLNILSSLRFPPSSTLILAGTFFFSIPKPTFIIETLLDPMSTRFYWGAATAAYQIEGAVHEDGRGDSIWDAFARKPGAIWHDDTGSVADDAYHKTEEDIRIMKELGFKAYRFSISWSRILPLGYGEVNQAGIDHYNNFISNLIAAGITPFVTLYHWDLPEGLERKYQGLLSPQFGDDFVAYADICFQHFGDRVKKWITINEPWTISYMGYGSGAHAPGRCSNRKICTHGDSSIEPYIVGHNLLNAHAAAVERYRQVYQPTQRGEIGIVLNLDWGEPLTSNYVDNCAAMRHNEFQLGWFADPIFFGRYPDTIKAATTNVTYYANGTVTYTSRLPTFTAAQRARLIGSVDFLGLNHYSTKYYVDASYSPASSIGQDSLLYPANQHKIKEGGDLGTGWVWDQQSYSTKYDRKGRIIGPQAASDWLNVVPWGIFNVLIYVHNRYSIAYAGSAIDIHKVRRALADVPGVEGRPDIPMSWKTDCHPISPSHRRRLQSNAGAGAGPRGSVSRNGSVGDRNQRENTGSGRSVRTGRRLGPSETTSGDDTANNTTGGSSATTVISTTSGAGSVSLAGSYASIPIYITENGVDVPGESQAGLSEALRDSFRIGYLSSYLDQMQRARAAGVDIRGYFVWSLLDNFEWADGYDKRFGLVYVDYASPNRTRHPKDSAHWYRDYIATVGDTVPAALADLDELGGQESGSRLGAVAGEGEVKMDLLSSGLLSAMFVLALIVVLTVVTRWKLFGR